MASGVVVMAYGSPESGADVDAYLENIRGGRPAAPGLADDLRRRYDAIGGRSPLAEITSAQAAALSQRLGLPVAVGMRHWRPTIAEAAASLSHCDRLAALVLAPHWSAVSVGAYARLLHRVRPDAVVVPFWWDHPGFVAFTAARVREARDDKRVVFTAHSLPERVADAGDPYRDQLYASAAAVAREAGVDDWELAFQSAPAHGGPWLGPDVRERLGAPALVVPIGFVSDHLEILYDLDVAAAAAAGAGFARTRLPNTDPQFIDLLADIVSEVIQ